MPTFDTAQIPNNADQSYLDIIDRLMKVVENPPAGYPSLSPGFISLSPERVNLMRKLATTSDAGNSGRAGNPHFGIVYQAQNKLIHLVNPADIDVLLSLAGNGGVTQQEYIERLNHTGISSIYLTTQWTTYNSSSPYVLGRSSDDSLAFRYIPFYEQSGPTSQRPDPPRPTPTPTPQAQLPPISDQDSPATQINDSLVPYVPSNILPVILPDIYANVVDNTQDDDLADLPEETQLPVSIDEVEGEIQADIAPTELPDVIQTAIANANALVNKVVVGTAQAAVLLAASKEIQSVITRQKVIPKIKDPILTAKQLEASAQRQIAARANTLLEKKSSSIAKIKEKLSSLSKPTKSFPKKPLIDTKILKTAAVAAVTKALQKERKKISTQNILKGRDAFTYPLKPNSIAKIAPSIPDLPIR